jgi:hypothetical protein
VRNNLIKALPRVRMRAWLGARFHQFAMPSIIRRHPRHSAGIAGATALGSALLILALQAHSPTSSGMEASAGVGEVSAAQSTESRIEETAIGEETMVMATASPLVERASLRIPRDEVPPAPDAERWAAERQQSVRRIDETSPEGEDRAGDADPAALDIEPDRTFTAAIRSDADRDGGPDGVPVAIAESEIEVAALETRMSDHDSAVFATTTASDEQGQAMGQGLVKSYVNMRAGPDNEAEILKVLPENAAVSILDDCPNWCEVEHDGTRGFVFGSFVEPAMETGATALDANTR